MLLKFGARNFTSFKESIEISFELGAKCPLIISKGKPIANLLCVKGANGSGKSNVLKIPGFLHNFCCDSFNNKPDEKILIESFFYADDPVNIFCDFIYENTKYCYELSLNEKKVISEKLSRKVKRLSTVFARKGNKLTHCIYEYRGLRDIKLRTNASIISTAHQYEIKIITPIYNFFDAIINNYTWSGRSHFSTNYRKITKFYEENPQALKKAIEIIKECDMGITNIEIHKTKDEEDNIYYFPIFVHDTNIKKNWLTYRSQSLGTKSLYLNIPYYYITLKFGGVLIMDEFDTDFHPHILPKIVSLFDNEKINDKNAQLLYSTHNTDILEYMSKYRTIIINKDSSESYGYRLDEIPGDIIRNDRPIVPVYNSGKIGGVPRI